MVEYGSLALVSPLWTEEWGPATQASLPPSPPHPRGQGPRHLPALGADLHCARGALAGLQPASQGRLPLGVTLGSLVQLHLLP